MQDHQWVTSNQFLIFIKVIFKSLTSHHIKSVYYNIMASY